MRTKWFFALFLLSFSISAQEIYSLKNNLQMDISGELISSPFAGGINSAQIQTIDLTQDGQEEWVIWDINSRQLQVFSKTGDEFIHLPELSYFFPEDISGFLTLADFDGDGKKDLFTSTALGIKAYKNTTQSGQISWSLAQNFLKLDESGNIQANNLDTPLIQDLDGDGDLDLVIFNFAAGDYLEFYKNTSIERKGTADIDGFEFPIRFWGNFVFCGCDEFSFGQTCDGSVNFQDSKISPNQRIQHAGGHSILYEDFSGDGIRDLVLGRDECNSLFYLPNEGSNDQPLFTNFETSLPGFGEFPSFPRFHVGQQINDQFIISINTNEASANFGINFKSSIVNFKADSTSDFDYVQKDILDLGENTRPFFKGNKSNGELVISSNITRDNQVRAELTRFTFTNGVFNLIENDFLGISSKDLLDVQFLEFKDVQNQSYRLVSGVFRDNNIPKQQIFRVLEKTLDPISFTGYEPRVGDYIQFFRNDENQDLLLVARQNGGLDLFEVNFNSFAATLIANDFLGFSDNPANRNLSIAVDASPQPDLYAVDQRGKIIWIQDFLNSDERQQILLEIGDQNLETRLGRNTWISLASPLFEDGADLILGTRGGGLIYLSAKEVNLPGEDEFQFKIFPNPSQGQLKVLSNLAAKGRLINSLGQVLLNDFEIPANTTFEIHAGFLSPGLYILQVEIEGQFLESKKIWIR